MCYMYNIHLSVILWNEIEKQKQNKTQHQQKTNPENPRRIKTICAMGKLKKKKKLQFTGLGIHGKL